MVSVSIALLSNACFATPVLAEASLPNFSLPIAPIIGDDTDAKAEADKTSGAASAGGVAGDGKSSDPTSNLTVHGVKIEGNRLVPTEDILNVVKTRHGDKFDREQVMQDLKAINSMGYFDDRSLQVTPELTNGGSSVLLKIRVQENAPVTQFSFQGNKVLGSEEISKVFADQLGRPQNLNQLSSAIDKVEQAYHEKGFILARITDVKDDPDGSIGLKISEGVVDKIEIIGNHKTKDYIIRDSIKVKQGAAFNDKLLTADLRKLYANGYFQDIRRSLTPSPDDPDKYTLKVEVDEKRTGSIGLGGGLDSIAGPFGSLSFSDANFRGRGQVLQFNSQVGAGVFGQVTNALNNAGTTFIPNQQTYNVEATFIEPNLLKTNTSMAVSGFGRSLPSMLVAQSMQRTLGSTVNFTKALGNNFNASLGFTGQNTFLNSVGDTTTMLNSMTQRALVTGVASNATSAGALAAATRATQLKGGTYLSVNPSLAYDTRDAAIDASRGTLAKISAGPSLGLGNSSFLKMGASVSQFIPVTRETTLALNMQGGSALGGMPQFAQYNLGGWNGMRGYRQFSDLGTGSSMLMATAEVRRHLPFIHNSSNKVAQVIDKHVKFTTFFDVGDVGGNSLTNSLLSRSGMGASVGVGLRVKLPMIGMVRIDYGMPLLNTVLGGYTPRFTFGFGEKF